ncbi:hypothetical protein [Bacillus wiedmannii]|uniref:hypothetical protein n=1 Tax=Bacillus wiedmannii TaxID=1890302 RepID=UPI000B170E53|nr:hypothetical protein [Bacillus wiedmannii]
MKELQEFTKGYQRELNFHIKDNSYERCKTSLLTNYMLLTTENKMLEGYSEVEAFQLVKEQITEELGKEISDCIAYLCKLANFFGRNMETDSLF